MQAHISSRGMLEEKVLKSSRLTGVSYIIQKPQSDLLLIAFLSSRFVCVLYLYLSLQICVVFKLVQSSFSLCGLQR